jgi:hypothetical protein
LARGYEERGDRQKAEQAYRIGIELAPNYFYSHWVYGNSLLRHEEIERSFAELRRAADVYLLAISNICDLIWQTTGGNAEIVTQFGLSLRSGSARSGICECLLSRAEYQRAVDIWRTLKRDDPAKSVASRSLVSSLSKASQWSLAHLVWRDIVSSEFEASGKATPADLSFWNGDFESDVDVGGFDWHIKSTPEVGARLDSLEQYHGQRSLVLNFNQHQRVSFNGVTHNLWVEPSTRYRLRFYYKTEELPERNGLAVVLSDAEMPARFTVESGLLGNQRQWTEREVFFETPAETRMIRLSIVRRPVGQLYDYIEGRVWFDTFSLEPL